MPEISHLRCSLFADDACFSFSDKCPIILEQTINNELCKIGQWFNLNKLCLNLDKTNYIIFTKKRLNYDFNICINNDKIKETSSTKYLGVIIDNKLSWKPHIDQVVGKLSKGCWAVCRIRPYVNLHTLKIIYYSLIYPHLQYCVASWGLAAQTHLNSIITKQKRIIKIMTFNSMTSSSNPIFIELNLLKFNDIYKLKVGLAMRRLIGENSLGNNDLSLLSNTHSYSTRSANNNNFFIPSVRTNLGKTSLKYQGPIIWNSIPNDFKSLPLQSFKTKVRNHLFSYYNNVH